MTTAALLWAGVRRFLIWIGGWLLGELAILGARGLAMYLRARARHHARRRGERLDSVSHLPRSHHLVAGAKRRAKWDARRAQRYLQAARWLEERTRSIRKTVVDAWTDRAEAANVPFYSPHEEYGRVA